MFDFPYKKCVKIPPLATTDRSVRLLKLAVKQLLLKLLSRTLAYEFKYFINENSNDIEHKLKYT